MHIDRQIRLAEQYNLKGLPGWRTKGAAVAIAEVLSFYNVQIPFLLPRPPPRRRSFLQWCLRAKAPIFNHFCGVIKMSPSTQLQFQ